MNWVDITVLALVGASTLLGLYWGLIRQAIAVAGVVAGILLAGRFYQPVAEFLHGKDGGGLVADANWARIIAFAGILLIVGVLVGAIGSLVRVVARLLYLGWLDHLLGALLGLVMAITLVTPVVVVATVFPVPGFSESVHNSQVAHWLSGYGPVVLSVLPPEFRQYEELVRIELPVIPAFPQS
jgi:membrane protein required for colicin V production